MLYSRHPVRNICDDENAETLADVYTGREKEDLPPPAISSIFGVIAYPTPSVMVRRGVSKVD